MRAGKVYKTPGGFKYYWLDFVLIWLVNVKKVRVVLLSELWNNILISYIDVNGM